MPIKKIEKDREFRKGERLSKYKSYSEQDILENRDAKMSNSEMLEENILHNMPMINGVPQEGFREPQEIKTGGLIQGKPKLALRGWK